MYYLFQTRLPYNNQIYDNRGGGILIEDGINIVSYGNIISNHRVEAYYDPCCPEERKWWCGGIWIDGSSFVETDNNTFINNKAGILISNFDEQYSCGYQIINCKFNYNHSGIEIMDFTPSVEEDIIRIEDNIFIKNINKIFFNE